MNYEYAIEILNDLNGRQYSTWWNKSTVLQACRYIFKLKKATKSDNELAERIMDNVYSGVIKGYGF